jgi:hypothetical protein
LNPTTPTNTPAWARVLHSSATAEPVHFISAKPIAYQQVNSCKYALVIEAKGW